MKLILASGSPRRLQLLQGLGWDVEVRRPDVDETPTPSEAPEALVARLSQSKAESVARHGAEVVLAADTVVALGADILGKPGNEARSRAMLRELSGREHQVLTGVCVVGPGGVRHSVVASTVVFRELSALEIETYVATGEPFDKAGAYGIQGHGIALVERVEGSYTNVIGLPVSESIGLVESVRTRS